MGGGRLRLRVDRKPAEDNRFAGGAAERLPQLGFGARGGAVVAEPAGCGGGVDAVAAVVVVVDGR